MPVWTSLLYVNDWFQPGSAPLKASISNQTGKWQVEVENLLDRPLTETRIVIKSFIYDLGTLPARQKKTFTLDPADGTALQAFVPQHGAEFQGAVASRHRAFSDEQQGHLNNLPLTATVASFPGYLPKPEHQRNCVSPPGFDLSPAVARGAAVLLAWDANHSLANPVIQFKPPRLQRNTLLRLVVPMP